MTQRLPLVMPKSPLGQAVAYSLPRWEGLSEYALHGQIEIDNNLAENVIRLLAIGRKAFLFAGSHQAAEMTAAMYSFMATCKKNGVDEQEWLKDVFERSSHTNKKIFINCFQITGSSSVIRTLRLPARKPNYTIWVRRLDTIIYSPNVRFLSDLGYMA